MDKNAIRETIEAFLEGWDRQEWMAEHGEWASAQWDDARAAYDDALADLREAADEAPDADRFGYGDMSELESAFAALQRAAQGLDSQVLPDEGDYIAEGIIDPDGVREGSEPIDVGQWAEGWDCREGWSAYRLGDALVMQWWRAARGNRHDRDLWIVIDREYFARDHPIPLPEEQWAALQPWIDEEPVGLAVGDCRETPTGIVARVGEEDIPYACGVDCCGIEFAAYRVLGGD